MAEHAENSSEIPLKSSKEILNDLFKVLNSKLPSDLEISDEELIEKRNEQRRKSKKKRRKKEKEKRRERKNDDEDDDEGECKKRSTKKRKRRRRSSSDDSDDTEGESKGGKKIRIKREPKSEKEQDPSISTSEDVKKPFVDFEMIKKAAVMDAIKGSIVKSEDCNKNLRDGVTEMSIVVKTEVKSEKPESSTDGVIKTEKGEMGEKKGDMVGKAATDAVFEKPDSQNVIPDGKSGGKIVIGNVYDAAAKQIREAKKKEEETLKKRKEKFEDGELSPSSSSFSEKSPSPYFSRKKNRSEKRREHSRSTSVRKTERRKRSRERKRPFTPDRLLSSSSGKRRREDRYRGHSRSRSLRPSKRVEEGEAAAEVRKRSRGRSRSRDRLWRRSGGRKSRSRSRTKWRRQQPQQQRRRRSPEVAGSPERIDKKKLLEIARKNALSLLKQGALPDSLNVSREKLAVIKAGGKTVDELTDFCKHLAKKDAGPCSSSNSEVDSSEETAFHHPFLLKERANNIVMNIRNSVPLPTMTGQEKTTELSKQLRLQFPVSSGQQHRKKECEWIPVTDREMEVPKMISYPMQAIEARQNEAATAEAKVHTAPNSVFPNSEATAELNISSIVAERLEALRKLNSDPNDPTANSLAQHAEKKLSTWVESKQIPGKFTGSTGVKLLSQAELSGGSHAWAKKNQLKNAPQVNSRFGMAMLQKLGWKPGEGLGKHKQGPVTPFEVDIKMDKKGLVCQDEILYKAPKSSSSLNQATQHMLGKHPVSLLNEYCSRKRIPQPVYTCEELIGIGHKKMFIFTVSIQGMGYKPKLPSANKKQSKMEAALVSLQALGLVPVSYYANDMTSAMPANGNLSF